MADKVGGVGGTTQREELERTLKHLGHAVLGDARLAHTWGSLESNDIAQRPRTGNPLGERLHNLRLGRSHSVDSLVQHVTRVRQILGTRLRTIRQLDRERDHLSERNAKERLDPRPKLVSLRAVHLVQDVDLLDDSRLQRVGNRQLEDTELEGNIALLDQRRQTLHLLIEATTLRLGQVDKVVLLVIVQLDCRCVLAGLVATTPSILLLEMADELILLGLGLGLGLGLSNLKLCLTTGNSVDMQLNADLGPLGKLDDGSLVFGLLLLGLRLGLGLVFGLLLLIVLILRRI